MSAQTVLAYLKNNVGVGVGAQNDFVREWRTLDDAGRNTLKTWAREEAAVLGIELTEAPSS